MGFHPGMEVATTFGDPELPEGSVGIVIKAHPDPADGVDIVFPAGQFNVIASGLIPATRTTEK